MSLFKNLGTEGLEDQEDRLGGFSPLETDIYTGTIKLAYAGAAPSGAQFVALVLDFSGKEYRETIYITNREGKNWFPNKDDKTKKVPLPGFTTIDNICLVATEKPLSDQDTEDKIVKVWDATERKEVNKSVPVLVDLLGKEISVAIIKVLENKSVRADNGEYVPTAETREANYIEKVFHTETKMTVAEIQHSAKEATFWHSWLERNKGKERDKRTVKDGSGAQAGRPTSARTPAGPPQAANGAGSARKSLFPAKS